MASLKFKEVCCLIYSGILFVSGLLLLGFSAYLLFKLFYHFTFIPSGSVGPFFVICLLGFAHLFLTWLGIKGPTREHNFHIVLFMVLTLILLVCEFAVGIWSIILWDEVEIGSIDLMTASFNELITLNYYKKDWNKLQSELKCCGLNGKDDYNKSDAYPASCFLNIGSNTTNTVVFVDGCKMPLIRYVKRILIDGAIIGFMCALLQAIGVFAFYTFFQTLREERTERITRRVAMQREVANSSVGQYQSQPQSASGAPINGVSKESTPPIQPATPPVSASK